MSRFPALPLLAGLISTLTAFSAFAGMTPEEIRARLLRIEAEMDRLDVAGIRDARGHTLDSVRQSLRDIEIKRFELDLQAAQLNARREVVVVHAAKESERNRVESEVLERKLDQIKTLRDAAQAELARVAELIDAGKLPAREVTAMKLNLIKLDEESATIRYQLTVADFHFAATLADIETELAGLQGGKEFLNQHAAELENLLEQFLTREEARIELKHERADLEQALEAQLSRKQILE